MRGLHREAPRRDSGDGVVTILLCIAFVVFLLTLPGLRDLFDFLANPLTWFVR